MTQATNLPVIILGGGGHAKVLVNTLLLRGRTILGFVDLQPGLPPVLGVSPLGGEDAVARHAPDRVRLVNGLGSTGVATGRRRVFEKFQALHYVFEPVVHPAAVVAPDVVLAEGVQVMAGAIIQPGTRLGANAIINTGARIDHDCTIGAHVHVAPGATLSGNVTVGDGSLVGTGASVIQGITVGPGSIVGAGAAVVADVPAGVTVAGVPARPLATPAAKS